MNVVQRVKAPTPKFFKVLRAVGACLAIAGVTVVTSPIAIPAIVVSVSSYVILAGTVITAVSQTAVETHKDDEPNSAQ